VATNSVVDTKTSLIFHAVENKDRPERDGTIDVAIRVKQRTLLLLRNRLQLRCAFVESVCRSFSRNRRVSGNRDAMVAFSLFEKRQMKAIMQRHRSPHFANQSGEAYDATVYRQFITRASTLKPAKTPGKWQYQQKMKTMILPSSRLTFGQRSAFYFRFLSGFRCFKKHNQQFCTLWQWTARSVE